MADDNASNEPSAFFTVKEWYGQTEAEWGLRKKLPSQTKLTFDEKGLGLRMSTGTQDEPVKKKKSCIVKSKPRVTKHTVLGSIANHMKEIKKGFVPPVRKEEEEEKVPAMKENEDPNSRKENEIGDFTPPFVVDLLTQEGGVDDESNQSTMQCSTATNLGGWETGGWTNSPDTWVRVFQARSTEDGADFFVDRRALGEVAVSLFRELTSQTEPRKTAAENFGDCPM
jgi:hypothetical protein